MKQYLLFAGDEFYAGGGWDDFIDSFDTDKEALEAAAGLRHDWWHIVDTIARKQTTSSEVKPWGAGYSY